MPSTFNARDAAVYERSMGRWSRRLASSFLAFTGVGERVLDVGCGTGSLLAELAGRPEPRRIAGIDASPIYAAAARARLDDPRVEVLDGDACAMPFADAAFDTALSQLVLQFVPDPGAALAEMARVVQPGGTVAAAVWNSAGGMPHQRMFWDTAACLDPAAAEARARTFNRATTREGELPALFAAAGLQQVATGTATVAMTFSGFEDFWGPIAAGEGTLGKYVLGLQPGTAALLRDAVQSAFLSGEADGPRVFHCTAFLCRGVRPTPGPAAGNPLEEDDAT